MTTRGAVCFQRNWNGPWKCYYQHNDTYPSSLGVNLIRILEGLSVFQDKMTPEDIIEETKKLDYNLQAFDELFAKPEDVFLKKEGDLEWIYAIEIESNPERSSVTIYRTSNPLFNKPFCFRVWGCYIKFFPSQHEVPKEMHRIQQAAGITIQALRAYHGAHKEQR